MESLIIASAVFAISITIIIGIASFRWRTAEPSTKGLFFIVTGLLLLILGLLWSLFLEYRYFGPATIAFISALCAVGLGLLGVGLRNLWKPIWKSPSTNDGEWTTRDST